ncbi:isochorismatase family cysteine hydrolase [Acuticoccus sp. I52.16.1]|uniref:isochorismatase family cysteine hydrolase n=1 Tax=Acuticoccus sp. I52.16.1 TaxID=2928472 RepID=UPI001FD5B93E|nr:isochorismatase family cysteine hydrolase [Acuticoccus sp. I52.16.1]UOM34223.1 cysteine hydrolase [Acuticoccus sp. I52.16.1]
MNDQPLGNAQPQTGIAAVPTAPGADIVVAALPEPVAISLATTALVIVDMQNAYLSKDGYLDRVGFDVSDSPPVIERTAALLAAARAAGLKTIFLQNGFSPDQAEAGGPTSPVWYKSNALKYMRAHPQMRGKLITIDTWDFAIVDALAPRDGEPVIRKARYSGFAGTNLEQMLRASGITTLLLAGVNTNVCVESTLRDAFHREFFGVMIPDATLQAGPDFIFEASVFNVRSFLGWTADTASVVAALQPA